ncbi:MAG TPA: DUF373 family protein, partial [Candidatus Thermoplasmatota archaeon]|nr:DUF373 family protein [Candidatus Thermoplasmatota archaeon]
MPGVLVLGVDRDDDFGRKLSIPTPIVGREGNVDAATRMLLVDPEESDANSMFAAVSTLDELRKAGEVAEVATICGAGRVGVVSDRKLARELDDVLERVRPDRCIFVTDGAEDEFILPLVASRVRVDHVRRVIVKQHAGLEGAFYVMRKALEDDKFQRTFLMPLALALLVYGIFGVSGQPDLGLGAIALTVGVYFLAKVLRLGTGIGRVVGDAYAGLTSGRVTFFTTMLALALVIGGAIVAANAVYRFEGETTPLRLGLLAGTKLVWWLVAAGLVSATGRVVDAWLKDHRVLWTYWNLPFSLVALGLVLTGAIGIVQRVVDGLSPALGVTELLQLALGFGV